MTINKNNISDAAACLEAGEAMAESAFRSVQIEGVPAVVVANGYSLTMKPELMERPKRRMGFLSVASLESFCRWINRERELNTGEAIILIDSDPKGTRGATFKAILNYHGEKPEHCDYGVIYKAELSTEWMKWMSHNAQTMLHAAFLEHMEDVMRLIIDPPGADLIQLLGDLTGHANARFSNALNLFNGSSKLSFEEDVTVRGSDSKATKIAEMQVPNIITAALPVFEFDREAYPVKNKIRYRIQDKKLMFSYEAIDPHLIIQDAVKAQVKIVQEATETDPYLGKV